MKWLPPSSFVQIYCKKCGKNTYNSILFCNFATLKLITEKKYNIMEDRLVIAGNIKRLRDASGFTQDNVANYLNVNRSAYANYEAGTRELPLNLMEKLADLYGCEMYDLYSEDVDVVSTMLATAFRVDTLSRDDMEQIAAFKRIVNNSLKMDKLLAQ